MFAGLNPPYSTIVADPPWDYGSTFTPKPAGDEWQKGAKCRYGVMSPGAIAALPVPTLRPNTGHLWIWTTHRFMVDAHSIAVAWGYTPKTILTWGKVQPDGAPSMKTGHWLRSATEYALLAVRGAVPRKSSAAYPTLMLGPRLPHSVKPAAFGDLVERISPGPYLEMFARAPRLGWDSWGHGYEMPEVPSVRPGERPDERIIG